MTTLFQLLLQLSSMIKENSLKITKGCNQKKAKSVKDRHYNGQKDKQRCTIHLTETKDRATLPISLRVL